MTVPLDRQTDVDAAWVKVRLEQAGRALLALPPGKWSRPDRLRSSWPLPPEDVATAYGYGQARVRPPAPSKRAVDAMDEALGWLLWLPAGGDRRVVFARALVHPISDRYLYSYARLGRALGLSREAVRRRHADALARIARRLCAEGP